MSKEELDTITKFILKIEPSIYIELPDETRPVFEKLKTVLLEEYGELIREQWLELDIQ